MFLLLASCTLDLGRPSTAYEQCRGRAMALAGSPTTYSYVSSYDPVAKHTVMHTVTHSDPMYYVRLGVYQRECNGLDDTEPKQCEPDEKGRVWWCYRTPNAHWWE